MSIDKALLWPQDFDEAVAYCLRRYDTPFDALPLNARQQLSIRYLKSLSDHEGWEILENAIPQLPQILVDWLIVSVDKDPATAKIATELLQATLKKGLHESLQALLSTLYDDKRAYSHWDEESTHVQY